VANFDKADRRELGLMTKTFAFGLALSTMIMTTNLVQAQTTELQPPRFTASPIIGPAPLTVKFCASAGIGIDFGDGTTGGMGIARSGECTEGEPSYVTHTYVAAGTYQLRGFPCPSPHGAICGGVAQQAGEVRITVTPSR
jgi:hypothetical protein